ncbi:MAG: filamentous hemagglutinin N-terminal domain-containing protein, partial [Betaproteobacteria bacterium]|nr:filamentous hemagglutinin N-terminal domain-containing protein [Betaproteobacteria bacterium]
MQPRPINIVSNKLLLTAFHRSQTTFALSVRASLVRALLTSALLASALTSPTALAQIRADPSAPGNQRPTVLLAPNGVPLVNIQTPSAAGVSRNTYSQFDVQPNGAILNNSRTDTATQLGGWVQANPWLATGSARVILNEVNSSNPSHLNGWVEVAGSRAQVVVANPSGISCNGCGFINASKATLATGMPIVKSGSLESYHIPAGELRIEGLGLDARETNVLTILARSAQVNAAIWAQRLKVITGKNDVFVDANGDVTTIAPVLPEPLIITPIPGSYPGRSIGNPPPAFALDTAYLGGMYAGHIFILGTEEGLGTRNLGTFKANQEFTLSANGWLDVKGSISAPTVTLQSEQLTNRGLITGQTVSVTSPDIKNVGTGRLYGDQLALQADTIVNAPETVNGITHAPVIAARDRLVIGTSTLENRDGALIVSGGDAVIGRRIEASNNSNGNSNTSSPTLTATGTATTITNDSATIDIQGNAEINVTTFNNLNTHLTTAQVDEAPFHTQRLLVARSNAMYPASQCRGLGGRGDVFCIVHPEVYGKRQALLPVRTINQCFLGSCDDPVINYAWNDPMFDRFNVTPVGPPPAEPAVAYGVNSQGKPGGCTGFIGGPITTPACVAWRKDYAQWDSRYQASLDALSIPLNAYNAGVNEDNRLHKFEDYTWYELTGSPSRTQVTNSSPALLRVGGDLNVTGNNTSNNNSTNSTLTNKDSQIIVGGNINVADIALSNQETKGTYRVQYDGTAQFTTIETCGSLGNSHCREWHGKTPYRPAP